MLQYAVSLKLYILPAFPDSALVPFSSLEFIDIAFIMESQALEATPYRSPALLLLRDQDLKPISELITGPPIQHFYLIYLNTRRFFPLVFLYYNMNLR